MMSSLTRRAALQASGLAVANSLADCATVSDLFGAPSGPRDVEGQEVVVVNESTDTQTMTVTITNAAGKTIFDHTYTVKADHADQSLSLHGDPSDGSIQVSASGYKTINEPYLPLSDPRNPYHGDIPPGPCQAMDILAIVTDDQLNVTFAYP